MAYHLPSPGHTYSLNLKSKHYHDFSCSDLVPTVVYQDGPSMKKDLKDLVNYCETPNVHAIVGAGIRMYRES